MLFFRLNNGGMELSSIEEFIKDISKISFFKIFNLRKLNMVDKMNSIVWRIKNFERFSYT